MSYELLYTSAPKGLKPGSRGFCSVVETEGLPPQLRDRLESLSSYRHVFSPGHARVADNPVVYSHVRMSDNARTVSVLSRVADYGLDYSNRTNNLAHHVLLDASERPAAGPAWVLAQPGWMQTSWDKQVLLKRNGPVPPSGSVTASPAVRWKEIAGDAGWAGVLADLALSDPGKMAFLIFQPGQQLLPLFAEVIALLPPARRWDATFTTYYTGMPAEIRCAWRGILKGSPEEAQARRHPNALVLDLTQPLGEAPAGRLTQAARTGQLPPDLQADAPPSLPPSLSTSSRRAVRARETADLDPDGPLQGSATRFAAQKSLEASATDLPPELPPALRKKRRSDAEETYQLPVSKEVLALGVVLFLGLAGVAWVQIRERWPAAPAVTDDGAAGAQTISRVQPPAPPPDDGAVRPKQPEQPTPKTDRIRLQRQLKSGGEVAIPLEEFLTRAASQRGEVLKEVSRVESDGGSAETLRVTHRLDSERRQLVLRASELPGGELQATVSLPLRVHFANAQQPALFEVRATVTRNSLRLPFPTLDPAQASLQELQGASFRGSRENLSVRTVASEAGGELLLEGPLAEMEWPLTLTARWDRKESRVTAHLEVHRDPKTGFNLKLQSVKEKKAPPPEASPAEPAIADGERPKDVRVHFAAGEVLRTDLGEPVARPRLTLYQPPPPDRNTSLLKWDFNEATRSGLISSDIIPPWSMRVGLPEDGRRLDFEMVSGPQGLPPPLRECAVGVSGRHLVVLAPPGTSPASAAVTRQKSVTIRLDSPPVGDFGKAVWQLWIIDPLAAGKARQVWTPLSPDPRGSHNYLPPRDEKLKENEVVLGNVTFRLVPDAADPARLELSLALPGGWKDKSFREKLAGRVAQAQDKEKAELRKQLDLLDFFYPHAEQADDAAKPEAAQRTGEIRVCGIGYVRLEGSTPEERKQGPLFVPRAVFGRPLDDIRAHQPEWLKGPDQQPGAG